MPFSAGNGIMLQYMSRALGGNGSGALAAGLVGVEMPIYRYIGNVSNLETYDMDFSLPLINRGAVPRFFSFPTRDEKAELAKQLGASNINLYNWDIQVHARAGNRQTEPSLKDGKFDVSLPTTSKNSKYLVQKKDGTFVPLLPHSNMVGWNVATIVVAEHGQSPFSVNVDTNGRPVVGDGSNRTLARALPVWDDLIGVRIVEILPEDVAKYFGGTLPSQYSKTDDGIKLNKLIEGSDVLLSNSMLSGWVITGVAPQNGTNWTVEIVDGEVVVTFSDSASGEVVTVNLSSTSGVNDELIIMFSGKKGSGGGGGGGHGGDHGCNSGFGVLALLALSAALMRRKD